MKLTQHNFLIAVAVTVLLVSSPLRADDYRDARAELIAAYQQENFPAMYLAARKALVARPGYPGAMFNLALSQTLISDHLGSLQTLDELADKGIDFGAVELDEFAELRTLEAWSDYTARVAYLAAPTGDAEVVANYSEQKFVPEGIAVDDDGNLFLGSIHTGQLIKISTTPEVLLEKGDSWSVFGMRFHADGSLWFASAAVPQLSGVGADEGRTGLFRADPTTGELSRTAILPQYEEAQVLGDLLIADENTIYATDSLTGAIYRYYIDSNEFEVLVKRGRLTSPQGLVLDESGLFMYVADYNNGLFRVSLQDGSLAKLDVAENVTDYGIDGLYRYGNELVVIQNGFRPNRVAALRLNADGLAVNTSRVLASNLDEFDEPTLGAVKGDDFYFVANSHWNRFDRDNKLPDGLSGPIVLRLSLE